MKGVVEAALSMHAVIKLKGKARSIRERLEMKRMLAAQRAAIGPAASAAAGGSDASELGGLAKQPAAVNPAAAEAADASDSGSSSTAPAARRRRGSFDASQENGGFVEAGTTPTAQPVKAGGGAGAVGGAKPERKQRRGKKARRLSVAAMSTDEDVQLTKDAQKRSAVFNSMVTRYWKLLMNEGNGECIDYDVYSRMHTRIAKTLMGAGNFDVTAALKTASEDWDHDVVDAADMSLEKLQASLFELAELWIEHLMEHLGTQIDVRHITTEQLCLFLTLVLDNISTPRCYFEDMGLVDLLMEGAEKSLMDLYTAETEKPDEVRVSQTRAVGV